MGGKIADRENKENSLKTILIWTSILVLLIPFIQKNILVNIATSVKKIWNENEKKYQKELNEKYNSSDIFKNVDKQEFANIE